MKLGQVMVVGSAGAGLANNKSSRSTVMATEPGINVGATIPDSALMTNMHECMSVPTGSSLVLNNDC